MSRYIAFLRAINVGGHTVKMEELRGHFASLGLSNVESFIASGNIIFESGSKNARDLRKKIEKRLHGSLGYEVATFLRTDAEIAEIAGYEPFPDTGASSASKLNVAFLADPPSAAARKALMGFRNDIDDFHVHGREVYWLRRHRPRESKFSNAALEKALDAQATLRSINTVRRLAAKYAPKGA